MEAVRGPAHLAPPGALQAKQLRHLHAQLLLEQSCHRQKKVFHLCTFHLSVFGPTLCEPVDCGLPGFSVREGFLQTRILECIGQEWFPYPSRELYFLLPQLPTPLSTWCCQNPCNSSSCTTSTSGPPRGKAKSSRAASGANPSGQPTCRGGNKTTIETQGQCD